jgi:hypothetical protein
MSPKREAEYAELYISKPLQNFMAQCFNYRDAFTDEVFSITQPLSPHLHNKT